MTFSDYLEIQGGGVNQKYRRFFTLIIKFMIILNGLF